MTVNEIERKIDKNEKIRRINKSIELKREKYMKVIEFLDKGLDITTGIEIHDKATIERRKIEEREKFYNYLERKQNQLVEIDSDIYEEENTNAEEFVSNKKGKNRKNYDKIAFLILLNFLAAGSIFGISNYVSHENEIKRKTKKYSEALDEVVDNSTYTRIGNLVYQNGVIVEKLDESKTADDEYTYIDYSNIASYIKESDNPDLAAFTLYKYYGRENNNPTYHKIVTQTFKTLQFDGSEMGSIDNFQEYLNANGYDTYNDYYKASRKELFSDGDSNLDNIKVKIKKMTK